MNSFPSGTVTFLFTDIEGSTNLAREHPETWEAGLKISLDEALELALRTVEEIK
jgi:class 3 adenylate cyclase